MRLTGSVGYVRGRRSVSAVIGPLRDRAPLPSLAGAEAQRIDGETSATHRCHDLAGCDYRASTATETMLTDGMMVRTTGVSSTRMVQVHVMFRSTIRSTAPAS